MNSTTFVTALVAAVAGAAIALLLTRRPPSSAPVGILDARLEAVTDELERVGALVHGLERDRAEQYGALEGHLRISGEQTARLAETTRALQAALTHPQARGQWGERMADDVLQAAGFVEGVNYRRQRGIDGGGIPDFTFLLPRDQLLHMDVKFPLDNYLRVLQASNETDSRRFRTAFLRDARDRVKELAARGYCEVADGPDCVLLFIPNEAVYAYLHENDSALLDDSLRAGVVLCSPMTLFAVLAVVRQASDNFAVEQTSREILTALSSFRAEWGRFVAQMDALGRRLEGAQREFDALVGTRRRQVEKPLTRIDELLHNPDTQAVARVMSS